MKTYTKKEYNPPGENWVIEIPSPHPVHFCGCVLERPPHRHLYQAYENCPNCLGFGEPPISISDVTDISNLSRFDRYPNLKENKDEI